ncbi:MAG: putative LPS assembly protein LptD [Bacteroidetes bacterium]|nr:LPS-assembly protein LptD [Flavobacteriaceae bacterium]MDA0864217.1 putative LPS assembly protein LptD [Bacteroidota bacterium]
MTLLLILGVFGFAAGQTPKDSLTPQSAVADTLVSAPEFLEDLVDYYGEDYVYMDQENAKVFMYNKAYMTYLDYRIDAGEIILDYAKNEVYARGIDSAGVYSQLPVFVQGNNKVQPDSIRFNFETKKALVFNSRTSQNDINMLSQITKKENDSVYFLRNVKFTTSENVDDPEYYFYTRKAKFVPQKKVVTGLTNMYIADVPTPLGLPFAFFPLADTRASGFVIPNIGENNNRGFFLQNGGYYFALNDYVDLTVLGDYYTNGSYGLRMDSDYALRYKFRGNLSVRYENLINSERGFPDFTQSSLYNIRWRHTQDPKVNPSTRFSASVNLGSSRYLQQSINQTNNASQLVNTLSSSVSYAKSFDTEPAIQFSAAATHSQNTQTQVINMSLPNINASISRIFPFAPKDGAKKGVFQNINLQYDVTAENRFTTTDSLFFKPEMFEGAEAGARHSIPLGTNFKLLNYLSVSLGTNFRETWVGKTIRRSYDPELNDGLGGVVQDTVSGFDSYRTYGFSTGLGTTVYGTFNFGKDKKIQAIRHVVRPSVSYNISPGFEQYYEEYTIPSADPQVNAQVQQYSRFENTIYGAPGKLYSSSMSFALSNTLEAKVRNPDTTATEPKKIALLNNFNLSSAYNITADSLNWSNVQFTGSIPIVKKLDLNVNGSLDPYALNANNQKINTFNINNGGSLFRLVNANMSFNYSFSSKDFDGSRSDDDDDNANDPDFNNDTFRNGGRPDDLFGDGRDIADLRGDEPADKDKKQEDDKWYNNSIPWDFRLAYTITYGNQLRQNEISSNSLMMSSNISLSPKWRIGISSGYDFKNKGITLTQMRFERDLESWVMRFSWTPIGARNTSWNFFIGIRGSILRDIKYDKRREADRRL